MKRAMILVVTVLLLLPASALFAQKKSEPTTRTVHGVVTDAADAPVTGAVVKLENLKTQQIRSFITKDGGAYTFYELNGDTDYKLSADFQGASSGAKTLTSFDSRREAVINLKLNKK
jgi:hypothetical protein